MPKKVWKQGGEVKSQRVWHEFKVQWVKVHVTGGVV